MYVRAKRIVLRNSMVYMELSLGRGQVYSFQKYLEDTAAVATCSPEVEPSVKSFSDEEYSKKQKNHNHWKVSTKSVMRTALRNLKTSNKFHKVRKNKICRHT